MEMRVRGNLRLRGKLLRAQRNLPGMMSYYADQESEALVKHIRRHTPIKTGRLRRSIHPLPVRHIPFTKIWRTGAESRLDYASYVNDGTPPHIIRAKGKALKFRYRGVNRYAPYVKHPGTPAFRMFEKGAFAYRRGVETRFAGPFRRWKIRSGLRL